MGQCASQELLLVSLRRLPNGLNARRVVVVNQTQSVGAAVHPFRSWLIAWQWPSLILFFLFFFVTPVAVTPGGKAHVHHEGTRRHTATTATAGVTSRSCMARLPWRHTQLYAQPFDFVTASTAGGG